jgi:hypothetical protein
LHLISCFAEGQKKQKKITLNPQHSGMAHCLTLSFTCYYKRLANMRMAGDVKTSVVNSGKKLYNFIMIA